MTFSNDFFLLLAQGGFGDMLLPLMAVIALFYFMFVIPERRKQKKRESSHKDRMENLKKNDRVETIGGIRGVVVNVRRDEGEVVVRIDESTSTKIRLNLASIAKVDEEINESDSNNKKSNNNHSKAKT